MSFLVGLVAAVVFPVTALPWLFVSTLAYMILARQVQPEFYVGHRPTCYFLTLIVSLVLLEVAVSCNR